MLSARSHTLSLGNRNIKISSVKNSNISRLKRNNRVKVTWTLIRSRRWQWVSRSGLLYPSNFLSVFVLDINLLFPVLGSIRFVKIHLLHIYHYYLLHTHLLHLLSTYSSPTPYLLHTHLFSSHILSSIYRNHCNISKNQSIKHLFLHGIRAGLESSIFRFTGGRQPHLSRPPDLNLFRLFSTHTFPSLPKSSLSRRQPSNTTHRPYTHSRHTRHSPSLWFSISAIRSLSLSFTLG
ncbi:hypothetical protein CsSME_00008315 [Camellia sinensis var. sinensis]